MLPHPVCAHVCVRAAAVGQGSWRCNAAEVPVHARGSCLATAAARCPVSCAPSTPPAPASAPQAIEPPAPLPPRPISPGHSDGSLSQEDGDAIRWWRASHRPPDSARAAATKEVEVEAWLPPLPSWPAAQLEVSNGTGMAPAPAHVVLPAYATALAAVEAAGQQQAAGNEAAGAAASAACQPPVGNTWRSFVARQ